jgi:hypothetical protein
VLVDRVSQRLVLSASPRLDHDLAAERLGNQRSTLVVTSTSRLSRKH